MAAINLPPDFLLEMEHLMETEEEYQAFLESYQKNRAYGLRRNPLRYDREEFERKMPFKLRPIPWTKEGYYYEPEEQPGKNPYHEAGDYYIQEPSAMAVVELLDPKPGEYICDLCAAPGGKSSQIAGRLMGQGLLVSNEYVPKRAQILAQNMERMGVPNCVILNEDTVKLSQRFPGFFDRIVIDAPCSGEGMFHREPKMMEYWRERGPEAYVPIQRELILQGAHMLKPGGKLLYSTCTFSKKEDEEIIQWLLEQEPDMYLLPVKPYEGFEKGKGMEACVRIFPHKMSGEGHFLALLGKKERAEQSPKKNKEKRGKKPIVLPDCAEEFLSLLQFPLDRKQLKLEKDRLYLLPDGPDMPKLRYLRTGLFLGEIRKNRFEPAQALAMALRPDEFASCIHLNSEDIRTVKYLKGETLDVSDLPCKKDKGWQLVCAGAYPLGFGKLSGGILKNKYYAGWRWQ